MTAHEPTMKEWIQMLLEPAKLLAKAMSCKSCHTQL
jgi:hypothetical protein